MLGIDYPSLFGWMVYLLSVSLIGYVLNTAEEYVKSGK